MDVNTYDYVGNNDFLEYTFYSKGPKGQIKKVVRFTNQIANGIAYYNLGFGDWNEKEEKLDDFVATNNLDTEIVLATIAAIVIDFSTRFPEAVIYATGSTDSRTRKYQMGINKYFKDIEILFDIYGFVEATGWEDFNQGINYDAFLVRRK
jgi:hypothetical protein